jgi:hypothetical protein
VTETVPIVNYDQSLHTNPTLLVGEIEPAEPELAEPELAESELAEAERC